MKDSKERERAGILNMRSSVAESGTLDLKLKMEPVFLTREQMAAALQISIGCLRGMMRRKEITYYKCGKLVRFPVEALGKSPEPRAQSLESRTERH